MANKGSSICLFAITNAESPKRNSENKDPLYKGMSTKYYCYII